MHFTKTRYLSGCRAGEVWLSWEPDLPGYPLWVTWETVKTPKKFANLLLSSIFHIQIHNWIEHL